MTQAMRVDGLAAFSRNLKKLNTEVPKALRVALNEAAEIVLNHARPRVPRRTGRAAASLRASSTQKAVRVSAGGRKAPYYPWLDFGGRVGKGRSVRRPFLKEGRYLFPALSAKRSEFEAAVTRALIGAAGSAGIEVD